MACVVIFNIKPAAVVVVLVVVVLDVNDAVVLVDVVNTALVAVIVVVVVAVVAVVNVVVAVTAVVVVVVVANLVVVPARKLESILKRKLVSDIKENRKKIKENFFFEKQQMAANPLLCGEQLSRKGYEHILQISHALKNM